ncbi:MAG TPA: AraC family transcriptional regulator [Polyangiaceae bacterium]|nr:AraC family transcriptional regulator [Polyangiaceae bacterium]
MKKFFTHADLVLPAHHLRALYETAASRGADRVELLRDTGITTRMFESPDARFSHAQFSILANNAVTLSNDPALGLHLGQGIGLSQMGVLGLAMLSSATLGAALRLHLRYYRSLMPGWELTLRATGDRAVITIREAIPLKPFEVLATEAIVVAFVQQGSVLFGGPLPLRAIRLAYPAPPYAGMYPDFCQMTPSFGAATTEIECDASLLDAKVIGADPATLALAEQYCEKQAMPSVEMEGLVGQMRRLLVAPNGKTPDLGELARALQTSTRTLRRSLRAMKTSYTELLDESRRQRADELVRSTELTLAQVANTLGFTTVRSFRRAFKRWTGTTPGALRAEGDGA